MKGPVALSWLLLCSVSSIHGRQELQPDELISRLNYGTIFLPLQQFHLVVENHFHSFNLILPPQPSRPEVQKLMSDIQDYTLIADRILPDILAGKYLERMLDSCKNCSRENNLLQIAKVFKAQNAHFLMHTYLWLKYLLPDLSQPRRDKRSAYDSLITWAGLASANEVNQIKHNLLALKTALIDFSDNTMTTLTKHHSMQTIVHRDLNMISEVLTSHNAIIQNMSTALNKHTYTAILVLKALAEFQVVREELVRQRHNLWSLVEGRLTVEILDHLNFENFVLILKNKIKDSPQPLFIAWDKPTDHVKHNNFMLSRVSRNQEEHALIVTLRFPLTLTQDKFVLYRIISLAMAIDEKNQHSSIILNLPKFVAICPTSDYYLEYNTEQPIIYDGLVQLKHNPEILKSAEVPTCVYALLRLEREEILSLCKMALQPYIRDSNVLLIADSQVLLQNIDYYTLQHEGREPTVKRGCVLCLIVWLVM